MYACMYVCMYISKGHVSDRYKIFYHTNSINDFKFFTEYPQGTKLQSSDYVMRYHFKSANYCFHV